MSDEIMANTAATDATDQTTNQEPAEKTYTQKEFDDHLAGLKNSLTKRFEKQLAELGDLDELKQLKANAEKQKQEEALKRGEFEKVLQDLAAKKDAEIAEKNRIIEEYTVNTPLLNAAAKNRAVNPDQVVQLIRNQVRLGESGRAEVLDSNGNTRYDDGGNLFSVDNLVSEFLQNNPHFVSAAPSTSNTKSNVNNGGSDVFDLSTIDMKNPAHRERYRQAKADGLI